MTKWTTTFRALDPHTGDLKLWGGPNIEAPTQAMAQQWCKENAGHLLVGGRLVCEIPCKPGTYDPDFDNMIDYDAIENN